MGAHKLNGKLADYHYRTMYYSSSKSLTRLQTTNYQKGKIGSDCVIGGVHRSLNVRIVLVLPRSLTLRMIFIG